MNIPSSLKKLFFYRQHPEAALRYLPIVEILKKEKLDGGQILEVGSGSYGITPYLKKVVTGIDTSFDEPEYPLLKQVKGSGDQLSFKENQFEVVILSDVLEHIPKEKRAKVLNEAIRVAKKLVIVSGPFGQKAHQQDQKLADYSMKTLGKMHPFFKDHLKFGLPDVDDIVELATKNKKVADVKVVGQSLNLQVREWLMKFFITRNKLVYYFYLKGLMVLVPILRLINNPPCYRTLIKIKIE